MTRIRLRHIGQFINAAPSEMWRSAKNILLQKFLWIGKINLTQELLTKKPFKEAVFPLALFRGKMTGDKESADKICRHEFDLLGSGKQKLGTNINWQNPWDGSEKDIKNIWELSRFQFLPTLIKAFETRNDEKFALEAKILMHDWILKNPLGKGKNWQNTMEAAVRACNFSLAWYFLKNSDSWKNDNWQKTFLISILEHGKFIFRNLEYGPGFNTNHLIADLTGLLFLGVLFPQFKEARKWKARAIKELALEMQNQVYEDGVDYEASIPYHRLVCEFFGTSALLCKLNEIYLPEDFLNKLEKMFEFIFYCTKPSGSVPQIGDNDDGRLFILEDFYSWNKQGNKCISWLGAELFPLNTKFVQKQSKGFNYGKIYIMRKNDFYCIVDAGEGGQNGNAGHAHNDTFSFELNVAGEDFIIDPGTFVYTGDIKERNRFRGTQMHNTVMTDNEEQSRFRPGSIFSMHDDAKTQINKWDLSETRDILDVEHYGYKRLKNPVIHRRIFEFDKKNLALKIADNFIGKDEHELEFNFHFAAGVEVRKIGEKIEARKNGIKLEINLPQQLAENAVIHDDEVSPSYGVKIPAKTATIKLKCDISKNNHFEFIFRQI